MKIDLHIHSIASGHAFSTVQEIIDYSILKGMTHIGIVEHGSSMQGSCHEGYFSMLPEIADKMKSYIKNLNIYFGVEANIINHNGDLDSKIEGQNTFVCAGLHELTPYSTNNKIKNTQTMINAIKNNKIDILVHPLRSQFDIDLLEVASFAIENNVILELNNRVFQNISPQHLNEYKKLVKLIKQKHHYLIMGSDSHISYDIGNFESVIDKYKYLDLTKDILLNYHPEILSKHIFK